jgi:SAM-dependent methyltransferase
MGVGQQVEDKMGVVPSSGAAMSRYLPQQPAFQMLARIAPGVHRFLHKRVIKLAYNLASLGQKDETVGFMNWGYCSMRPEDPDPDVVPENWSSLHSLRLYYRVVRPVPLSGLDVLEVGSGRGGGASFIMKEFKPRSLTGIDFSPVAVAFCNRRYGQDGLSFQRGDAEKLPFASEAFDAVVNVESSHCYNSMERFLAEAVRVLRPGGHFLFADFRDTEQVDVLRAQMLAAGLTIVEEERITPNVLRALELDSDFKMAEIERSAGKRLRPILEQSWAVKGSPVYEAFRTGGCEYMRFVLQKATPAR